jgi:hypothetical protein
MVWKYQISEETYIYTCICVYIKNKASKKEISKQTGKKGTGSRVRTQAAGFTTCRYYHCAIGGYSTEVHPITIYHILHLVNTKRHQAVRRILFSPSLLPSHSRLTSPPPFCYRRRFHFGRHLRRRRRRIPLGPHHIPGQRRRSHRDMAKGQPRDPATGRFVR